MKLITIFSFLLLTYCILTHSELSLFYAEMGLHLWFNKMIPTLLPFMILSGIMIRLKLTGGFTTFIYPIIKSTFRVSPNVCYAMLMGFLCGFPMGAKTIGDLYQQQMITRREADYLLAFCNNIGPVYFMGFVLPLLHRQLLLPYLLGMYAIPLLYGFFLRYTRFRDLSAPSIEIQPSIAVSDNFHKQAYYSTQKITMGHLLNAMDEAITSAVHSILGLGGYMILFNLLNLLPHIILGQKPVYFAPLLEISGGLRLLQDNAPLYVLLLLPFGGFSCLAQTYNCIKNTPLSLSDYTKHKIILTALTIVYYLLWYLSRSNSFMR